MGSASENEVVSALTRAGYLVTLPYLAAYAPYDCIIDDGERLLRVQIKTGYVCRAYDSVRFATRSTSYHRRGGTARTYRGKADLFGVWVPELRRCFIVPVDETGSSTFAMRLSPARNNQHKRTRLAADYELQPLSAGPARVRERAPTWVVYSNGKQRGA